MAYGSVVNAMKPLVISAQLSLSYNIAVLLSVSLDLDWVRTRAAGGQFDSFPVLLRILYLLMALFMVYLSHFIFVFEKLSFQGRRLARIFGYIFLLSTFTQLISRSVDERFNAFPAAIIAVTLIAISKK